MNAAYVVGAIRLGDAEAQLERTHRGTAELQALIGDLSQAEGGVGGYMLTRDVSLLEPLDRARALLSTRLDRLNDILSDPRQLEDLRNQLAIESKARLTALERIRDDIRTHDHVPPDALATNRTEMQRVQATVSRMILRQDELLGEQRAGARIVEIWGIGAAVASALVGLACGVIAVMMLSGGRVARLARPTDGAGPVRAAAPPPASGRTKMVGSVLIVDDDSRIRELLRRWLAPHGLDVRQASNAKSGLSAVVEQPPEVILCDVHMPGGPDGLWLAERVRGVAPTTAIVLATGDSGISAFESFKKGVVSYVLKPFRREQVLEAVEEGIRWSKAESANSAKPTRGRQPLLEDGIV
jgi:CheY-like chemotaxis protein/CHASE3 domain sensor protein